MPYDPQLDPLFNAAGQQYNVDPDLLKAVHLQETGGTGRWDQTSPAGAKGGMQFIDSTAARYGVKDPFDPQQAIPGSAHLLSDLLGQYEKQVGPGQQAVTMALRGYNAGDPSRWNNSETASYAGGVAKYYAGLKGTNGKSMNGLDDLATAGQSAQPGHQFAQASGIPSDDELLNGFVNGTLPFMPRPAAVPQVNGAGGPINAVTPDAKAAAATSLQPAANQPNDNTTPALDVPGLIDTYNRYRSFPAGMPLASGALQMLQKMAPEGYVLNTDGSIGLRQGYVGGKEAEAAAAARGKTSETPVDVRQGAATGFYDQNHQFHPAFQNPRLPEGAHLVESGNGQVSVGMVPGALPAIEQSATAQAAGPAAFKPQEFYSPYGQEYLGTARQLPGNRPITASAAPGSQNLAVGGGIAAPRTPEAAASTFPVQTPNGMKDLSALSVNDMFPGGQGIPAPPTPPPGLGYGAPSKATEDSQKQDAERLAAYQQESATNQKIYLDLAHLRDALQRGLNTNNLTPLWANLGNTAQGLGLEYLIPKDINPNDASMFNKAATDLIFTAVNKLKGQVKIGEIEGLKMANPNLVIPIQTNYSILNDILSAGKWQDARSKLATDYWTQTGHAPLATFDAKFNQMVPLPELSEASRSQLRALGAQFPGDITPPTGAANTTPQFSRATIEQEMRRRGLLK